MIKKVDIDLIRPRLITKIGIIPVKVDYTQHYNLLEAIKAYEDYLKMANQPDHSLEQFLKLIKEFDYEKAKYLECEKWDDIYAVMDGFHRLCVMKHKGYKQIEIKCK